MESLNRGGQMESLSIICAVLCGLAVWLWPRRNVCDVGERAGNVVGRAGESLDEKPDGGCDGRSDGIEEANIARHRMCGVRGFPPRIRAQRSHIGAGVRRIGWNAVRHTRTYQASHNHGDPQPMPAQRAMRPSRTAERRAICGLSAEPDARMRNRPMPAGGG